MWTPINMTPPPPKPPQPEPPPLPVERPYALDLRVAVSVEEATALLKFIADLRQKKETA